MAATTPKARRCGCDRVRKGKPYFAGLDCAKCWNYWHVAAFHFAQGGAPETLVKDPRNCDCGCGACVPPPNPSPLSVAKITAADLGHDANDWVSNASIIRYRGTLLLAYRRHWAGADIWVRELREDFTPSGSVGSVKLNLTHPAAGWGREDPRFFLFRDRLHVAYAGVQGSAGPTQQVYARLRDDFTAEAIFAPPSPVGAAWEKNWSFFEYAGELHAVHSMTPRHIVLRIDGDRTRVAAAHPNPLAWSGGFMRGGASPVLAGGRFVSWFHGKRNVGKRTTYTTGVYTFEVAPPFRALSVTPSPVMHGDPKTRPADWRINNWFPCGAILDRGEWVVSAGAHDRWIEIARWSPDAIASTLTPGDP